jgi:gentisate 1,2-dioxygenase
MERERAKEPDPTQQSGYEKLVRHYQEMQHRQRTGRLLVKGDELEYQKTRQGLLKFYLNPLVTDTALSSWSVFEHRINRQTGRHKHQGGVIIFVIEGEGSTQNDDEVLEWQAGDLIVLPIKPGGGSSHQHWNKDDTKGCRWIGLRDLMLAGYIANTMDQVAETPDAGGKETDITGLRVRDWTATVSEEQVPLVGSPAAQANVNLFDRLVKLRDLQRARMQKATYLIRGDELPWELNAHGKMQWYLHPCIAYTQLQTHMFYRQEIAEGSRSGVQRHGGDAVFYIIQGEGYTEVDGVRHAWKPGDLMTLPIFPQGVVYRHVNTGKGAVRLFCMERNLVHTVNVDRQSGFEQLQPCPEYRASA